MDQPLSIALSIFGTLAVMAIGGLVSANIRVWAQSKGWDTLLLRFAQSLPEWLRPMITGWPALRQRWGLWLAMGISGGIAITMWIGQQHPPQPLFPSDMRQPNDQNSIMRQERKITEEHRKVFLDTINGAMRARLDKTAADVKIAIEAGCIECIDYAGSISDMMKGTPGIKVTTDTGAIIGPPIRDTGLNIEISENSSPGVAAIVAGLSAAGIKFDIIQIPKSAANVMEVLIIHPRRK